MKPILKKQSLTILDKKDINKNLPESISFFETLTKIKARVKHKAQSVVPIIYTKIYKSWKNWYKKNITWYTKEKLSSLKNNCH